VNLRNNGTRLAMVTKELVAKWNETKEYWKDAKSEEFEKKYIDELQASVDNAVIIIEQLDKIITKIRKDCE
jgi:tRNA uridine 5-carbamoylmethylation protein Kti12